MMLYQSTVTLCLVFNLVGSIRFYKPEPEKTEPNRTQTEKNQKKPSQIGKTEPNQKKPSQIKKTSFFSKITEPKSVGLNRFRFGFGFFFKNWFGYYF